MTHFDEKTIDLFVLNPLLLDEQTRSGLQRHLQECIGCRTLANFLQSYYADLERASKRHQPPSAHQEEVLRSLIPHARVIRLFPYRPRLTAALANGHEFVVLAAKSHGKELSSRFETVATLASDEERMLLRVVHDTLTDVFRAYLHADDPSRLNGALVSFESISLNLVLDEKGQKEFTLPEKDRPRDWSLVGTLVRTALGILTIQTSSLRPNGSTTVSVPGISPPVEVTVSYDSEVLNVSVTGQEGKPECSTALIEAGPENGTLVALKEGKATLPIPNLPDALIIRLYP